MIHICRLSPLTPTTGTIHRDKTIASEMGQLDLAAQISPRGHPHIRRIFPGGALTAEELSLEITQLRHSSSFGTWPSDSRLLESPGAGATGRCGAQNSRLIFIFIIAWSAAGGEVVGICSRLDQEVSVEPGPVGKSGGEEAEKQRQEEEAE